MKKEKLPIVCFAGCDWWYHNRGLFCPQVMERLSKDYKVLFVNSLGMRVPSLRKDRSALKKIIRKLRSIGRFIKKTDKGMYVVSPISVPFVNNNLARKLNTLSVSFQIRLAMFLLGIRKPVFYVGCLPAFEVVEKMERKYLIYERSDLFEEMPGANKTYIASLDDKLTKSADMVLYVNKAMWQDGMNKNEKSRLIGHGVDFELFAHAADSNNTPEDIANIRRPIVGFFGDISDKTSDMDLVKFVAESMPDISLVFVGSVSTDINGLKCFKNVHFLGQKPYEQVPFYGKEFDVAIMPWNRNKWIEFCNPVKIKEYLALGKPVVSTYYPEIEPYSGLVYVADDYDDFVSCIQKAIQERDSKKVQRRRKKVQKETWDSKVEQIKSFMEGNLN